MTAPLTLEQRTLLAIVIAGVIGWTGLLLLALAHPTADPEIASDFLAFFCGAKILITHGNPYLVAPLHACESALAPALHARIGDLTIPAPLPPYALAILAPLTLLPWTAAAGLWLVAIATASLLAPWLLVTRFGVHPLLAFGALPMTMVLTAALAGQLPPFTITATVGAAAAFEARSFGAGAVLTAIGSLEPHVGLPVAAAAFLGLPAARKPLFLAFAVLLSLSIAFWPVLPAYAAELHLQAIAETAMPTQFSLTHLLYELGVGESTALALGAVQYAIFAIAGVTVALRFYRQRGQARWLLLVPAAFAVTGGSYVHLDQIAAALPLAALLASEATLTGGGALVLLSLPWSLLAGRPETAILSVAALVPLLHGLHWNLRNALMGALVLCAGWVALTETMRTRFETPHLPLLVPTMLVGLASSSWAFYAHGFSRGAPQLVSHVPTIAGLMLMLASLIALCVLHRRSAIEMPA